MNNAPAFPTPEFYDEKLVGSHHGMTLRDYFAAHAPAEPWPHFMPVMPPCPQEPSYTPTDNEGATAADATMVDNLMDWRREPHWDIDECDAGYDRFSNWCNAWRAFWKANAEWKSRQWVERAEQWPWFYADAMLKRRDA